MKKILTMICVAMVGMGLFGSVALADGTNPNAYVEQQAQNLKDKAAQMFDIDASSTDAVTQDLLQKGTEAVGSVLGTGQTANGSTSSDGTISNTGDCTGAVCIVQTDGNKLEADSGVELLQKYASIAYQYIVKVCGLIGVLIMVVSGVQMMTAGADSGAYEEAKGRMMRTLGGIALLFCMAAILYTVNPVFFSAG